MKNVLLALFFVLATYYNGYAQKSFVAEGLNFEVVNDSCVKVVPLPGYKYIGDIVIPELVVSDGVKYSVTTIGMRAFASCTSLMSVQLPQSITEIEEAAFLSCSNLGNVVLPSKLEKIGRSVFQDCRKITKVVIPDSTKLVGRFCFRDCSALSSVTIGSGWKTIEVGTFASCKELQSIKIPATVECIEDNAFFDSRLSNVVILGKNPDYTGHAFRSTPYFTNQRSNAARSAYGQRAGQKVRNTKIY